MSKAIVYLMFLIWLGALLFSVSKSSWAADMLFAAISLAFGATVFSVSAATPESRRKYRPVGIILLVVGVLATGLSLFRKFL